MIALFRLLTGISLLTLGRKLFWLFVALIGFEAGTYVAARAFSHQPDWIVLVIAIAAGIGGALLAVLLQQVVIVLAGFVAGGYLSVAMLDLLNLDFGWLALLAFVSGGMLGAALVMRLFDWALIGLSSLAGALTLTQVLLPRHALTLPAILILFIIGVSIQAAWWQSEKRAR